MHPLRALILGALAYGAFLVATAPATLLAGPVARASGGQVQLTGATGTLWQGRARLALTAAGGTLAIDELRWRFLPARLAAGRVAFALEARAPGVAASLEAARSLLAWSLRDLDARLDAAQVAAAFPLVSVWQPAGTLTAQAPALSWNGREIAGEATAEWREAAAAISPLRPLGSWRAQARAEGQAIGFDVTTAKGPLRIAGNGAWAPGGRVTFAGEARAEAGHERDLESVLALLGPVRADGARALSLR